MSGYRCCILGIRFFIFVLLLCGGIGTPTAMAAQEAAESPFSRLLREKVEAVAADAHFFCRGKRIFGSAYITPFYQERHYRPAWFSGHSAMPWVEQLVSAIEVSGEEGFRPADYHLDQLKTLVAMASVSALGGKDLEAICDFDLLLTDAFFLLGSHLLNGRVNPGSIDPTWEARNQDIDLVAILKTAIEKGDVSGALSSLKPQRDGYNRLKKAIAAYKKLASAIEPKTVPPGPSIRQGDHDPRVAVLHDRLVFWGDKTPAPKPKHPDLFDAELDAALRRFQRRHGIEPDGVLGKMAVLALNYSASDRLSQLEVNLERWRWIPRHLGEQYILVNTADFSLQLISGMETLMEMRVVAGRPEQLTPVLSGEINYVVINPYWHVPHSIAVRDILPKLRKNPGYLREQHMALLENWSDNAPQISPEAVDWHRINEHNFRYKLRQDPGPKNSLGRIKFLFPNKFGVYLHDTPSRNLFKRVVRNFSSGCIRIEKPMDLAAYLLRDKPKWNYDGIKAQIDRGETRAIPVSPTMPVHLMYWTAWVDDKDVIQFREDVYGRDNRLRSVLAEKMSMTVAARN